jgi:flavin reductase (DIM6/NTAB) family NADH-FMN oxidoreductase RutF
MATSTERADDIRQDFDSAAFRAAMGCFATGVTIITTVDTGGNPAGLTANSFTSLSLDPPLVLFCLDRRSSNLVPFFGCTHFGVNMLGEDQIELSNRFASRAGDKWLGVEYATWQGGVPILEGCIANLECERHAVYDGGDHVILVGRVIALRSGDLSRRPLLYFRGRYGEFSSFE